MPVRVDRAKITLRFDLGFGDPVTPAPVEIEYPSLLDAPFTMSGYPLCTVIAEKVVTIMQRGEANTRERDIADIVILAGRHRPDVTQLLAAIKATASHRQTQIRSVRVATGALGTLRQSSWEAFVQRAELTGRVPVSYQAALDLVSALIDPMLDG